MKAVRKLLVSMELHLDASIDKQIYKVPEKSGRCTTILLIVEKE